MQINAVAKLEYNCFDIGYQSLGLKIVFKEPKKLFKTRLRRTLVCNFGFDQGEFLGAAIEMVENKARLRREVEDAVKSYVSIRKGQNDNKGKKDKLLKAIEDSGKIEVSVKIDG